MSNELFKKLEDERNKLQEEIEFYQKTRDEAETCIKDRSNKINTINQRLNLLDSKKTKNDPEISLHALIRYIERIHRINIEEIKKNLLSQKIKEYVNDFKNGRITENGITFIFKNRKIITIIVED